MSFPISAPIIYPESDGQFLADDPIQFRLIAIIHGGLDVLFINIPASLLTETDSASLLKTNF